jgi:predicted secreted protein with PEFG-CTERM motif
MIQVFDGVMELKEISIFIIGSFILLPFFLGESFAQEDQMITITTEKESYASGEPIQVSGLVETKYSDSKVILRVYSPINNLITIAELEVNDDGTFGGEIGTSIGGLWQKDGTYTIMANYFSGELAQTQFEYGGMISAGVASDVPEFSIVEDESLESLMLEEHEVKYGLSGARIIKMTPDYENKSLIIEIETFSDGELRISLPKHVIDTDEEGFFILVDGDETNHDAISDSDKWSLVIPFSYGSQEIEIIGTFVIPEFGTIAMLVLMTAIATIVIISAKNKQIFYPKT